MRKSFIILFSFILLNQHSSYASFRTLPQIKRAFNVLSDEGRSAIKNAYSLSKDRLDDRSYPSNEHLNALYSGILTLSQTSGKDISLLLNHPTLSAHDTFSRSPSETARPACAAPQMQNQLPARNMGPINTSARYISTLSEPSRPSLARLPADHHRIINEKKQQGHKIIIVLGAFPFERNHFNFDSIITSSGKPPFVIYIDSPEMFTMYANEGTDMRTSEHELFIPGDFNVLLFLETLKTSLNGKVDLITSDRSVSKFLNLHAYSLSILLDMLDHNGKIILDNEGQLTYLLSNKTEEEAFTEEQQRYNPRDPKVYALHKLVTSHHIRNGAYQPNFSSTENIRLNRYIADIYPQYFYEWISSHLGEYYTDRFEFKLQYNTKNTYWREGRGYDKDHLFIHITKR